MGLYLPYAVCKCLQVGVQGLQILKPLSQMGSLENGVGNKQIVETCGVNTEVDIVISQDDDDGGAQCVVNNLKFSVKQPVKWFSLYVIAIALAWVVM